MRKINFSLFLLLLVSTIAFGQTKTKKVDIEWGNPIKVSKKMSLNDIIGYDKTGFYAIESKWVNGIEYRYLGHYDKKMNLIKSVQLKFKVNKKLAIFTFAKLLNNKLYFFTTLYNKKEKNNTLYLQSIDKKTLLQNNDRKEINVFNIVKHSKYNGGDYRFILSNDTSKLLIYYHPPYEGLPKKKLGIMR